MAKWFKFTADYDHRWPSRAVTAFKTGMIAYVKDEVAEAAAEVGAGSTTSKPKDGDENRVTSGTPEESDTHVLSGNSVLSNDAVGRDEEAAATDAPDDGGTVSGEALSAASGGEQSEPVPGAERHPDLPPEA